MAHRPFTTPVPSPAEVPSRMVHAMQQWERIALKWRYLAVRRHAHFVDLYKSGRWKRYYTDDGFRAELMAAIEMAERWAMIAPLPEERAAPDIEPLVEFEQAKAA